MIGHPVQKVDNVTECLRRCRNISSCAHWAYFEPMFDCHVSDMFAAPVPNAVGFISGPPGCVSGSGVQLHTAIIMELQGACFTNGITYAPWFDNAKDLEAFEPIVVRDVMECQEMCDCAGKCETLPRCKGKCVIQLEKCVLFEYNAATLVCHLMPEAPMGVQISGDSYISGPPKCPGGISLNVTVENVLIENLMNQPDLENRFKLAMEKATLNRNRSCSRSEGCAYKISLRNGSNFQQMHRLHTDESVQKRGQGSSNRSVIATIDVFDEKGITFAMKHFNSTLRKKLQENVKDGLESITGLVLSGYNMHIYVSLFDEMNGKSKLTENVDSESPAIKDEIKDDTAPALFQDILTKTGGAWLLQASTCLLITLVVCISVSGAVWRWKSRSRTGYVCLVENNTRSRAAQDDIFSERVFEQVNADVAFDLGEEICSARSISSGRYAPDGV